MYVVKPFTRPGPVHDAAHAQVSESDTGPRNATRASSLDEERGPLALTKPQPVAALSNEQDRKTHTALAQKHLDYSLRVNTI